MILLTHSATRRNRDRWKQIAVTLGTKLRAVNGQLAHLREAYTMQQAELDALRAQLDAKDIQP